MSSTPRLRSKPIPGITPEQARDARARAWSYIFACHEKRKAVPTGGKDDMKSLPSEKGGYDDLTRNMVCNAEGMKQNKTRKGKNVAMDS